MLKSASQFRNPHLLSQVIFLTFHSRTSIANLPHYILNGPFLECYSQCHNEKPGPHNPGSERKECSLLIPDRYPSTERKSFSNLENKKPDLDGPGLNDMMESLVTPIIAYSEIKASGFPLRTGTFMSERFVKCIDGIDTDYLVTTNPHAFALSWIIAKRARREPNHPDGLKVGEALIGDWQDYGFTRQQYRTALKHLCQQNIIEIIETNRTRKKSTTETTTGVTTAGTRVRLLNTKVWDVNISDANHRSNHRSNHCPTTAQPLPNHEQEGIRKNKNEKEGGGETRPPPVHFFGKIVKMTCTDYDYLLDEYGKPALDQMIEELDNYCVAEGKTFVNYPAKIRGWFTLEAKRKKTNKIPEQSVYAFLQEKLGRDRVTLNDFSGSIQVTSTNGHLGPKFDKNDMVGVKKWLAERNGEKINGTA